MEDAKQVTIQDIADKAGVSISTVSRVLNRTVGVREGKRTAVQEAIAHLGYQPNIFAQGLASGQSMTIGILTQNISSPVYDAILHDLLIGFRSTGYTPLIADGHWQPEKEQKSIATLLARRVDGLIIIGAQSEPEYFKQLSEKKPTVIVGRTIDGIDAQCINSDNYSGGYAATKHLLDQGHRHIAHVTGIMTHGDAIERHRGYQQALLDEGITPSPELEVAGEFTERSGLLAVEMLLMRGQSFSAIFTANDQMALGARLALFRRGIRVPEDVSIVGYDDQPASAYMIPPLTTVRQPVEEIGQAAAKAILGLIKGEIEEVPLISAELIIRESTIRVRV